jgi:hypothetical protein
MIRHNGTDREERNSKEADEVTHFKVSASSISLKFFIFY